MWAVCLFVVVCLGGLAITLGCLWISHYALQLTSALADNVSANVIGLGLATVFRFWAMRTHVFGHGRKRRPATTEHVGLVNIR